GEPGLTFLIDRPPLSELTYEHQGVNPSSKEGFIGIHIADSGDDTLIEKRCFYGDVMPA
ncbi:unnamed protein product, partial [marine sediment metagenome]